MTPHRIIPGDPPREDYFNILQGVQMVLPETLLLQGAHKPLNNTVPSGAVKGSLLVMDSPASQVVLHRVGCELGSIVRADHQGFGDPLGRSKAAYNGFIHHVVDHSGSGHFGNPPRHAISGLL